MNRRLALNLRKRVRVQSQFTVADLGDGVVRLTCCTCGLIQEEVAGSNSNHRDADRRQIGAAVTKGSAGAISLARWWVRQQTISGECASCLAAKRDELYPLGVQ